MILLGDLGQAIRSGTLDDAFWEERAREAEILAITTFMGVAEAGAISKLEDLWEGKEEAFQKKWRRYLLWFIPAFFGVMGTISIIRTSRERVEQVGVEQALLWITGEQRANDIAVTETTRLYNWGVEFGKEELGEETKTWYTMLDERVCEVCRPMHNVTIPIGEMFVLPTGEEVPGPPAHGRCRCEVR